MRIILFAIIALATIGNINAQDESEKTDNTVIGENAKIVVFGDRHVDLSFITLPGQPMINKSMRNTFGNSSVPYSSIEGSPYLNPSYMPGTVTLPNGKEFNNVKLQVDLYSGDIVAAVENSKEIALNRKLYKSFLIPHGDQNLLFKKVNTEKPDDFFIVLLEDEEFTFFKKKYVTVREGSNYGLSKTAVKFIGRTDYFIAQKGKKTVAKIKLKNNDFISNLPKRKAKAFVEYTDKMNTKLKDEEDYIKALKAVSLKFKSSL